jgi:hypothetical protein
MSLSQGIIFDLNRLNPICVFFVGSFYHALREASTTPHWATIYLWKPRSKQAVVGMKGLW